MTQTNEPPLTGLRVIDAATVIAGPTLGMLLGDFGADVIKVEHPRGDVLRQTGYQKDGVGLWFKMANRNKRCVTLNLSTPKGQALFAGTRIAAFRAATLVGSSALVWVAAQSDWTMGFGAAGLLMLATAGVNRWVMPHPPELHPQETGTGAAHRRPTAFAFLEAYKTFVTQPKALLVLSFLLLYRVGDIMMFGQSKPFLRDLGVSDMVLLSNAPPSRYVGLEAFGLRIVGQRKIG